MAINRSQIRDLLLPGLADVEGKYPQIPTQYTQVFSRATSKMAIERAAQMRYTGLAQLKSEGAATVFDNASGERFVYNATMNGIGLGFAITRESLDDNLYKEQFGPNSMGLAESFAQTKEIIHASVLNTATTYDSTIGGDGVSLCSTAHPIDGSTFANRPSVDQDLNEASLESALNTIRTFPDQAGLKTFSRGKKLVVPIALQWTAERLLRTELRVGTANNDVNAIVSQGALPEGYIVMDFLTSNFAWFVTTNVKGLISYDEALRQASNPADFALKVKGITGTSEMGWKDFERDEKEGKSTPAQQDIEKF